MDRDQAGVLGRRVLRVEDERLLTVGGTYVDERTGTRADSRGAGHVRAQPVRARAHHRHRRLRRTRQARRGRGADRRGRGRAAGKRDDPTAEPLPGPDPPAGPRPLAPVGKHGPMSASTRIVVIGGGIVAASVAYHLARRGVSVIIVRPQITPERPPTPARA